MIKSTISTGVTVRRIDEGMDQPLLPRARI
jgi:hypothetical protein